MTNISLIRALGLLCLGATCLTPVGLSTAHAAGDDYRLGPQDKLRVKVYEWRASQDKIVEWEGLNDEFSVGANGALALPLVGEISAAGKTPAEVSTAIGERLRERMNLVQQPDTSVQVTQYRPFYISGDIMKPGDFPFRPGLTVLQAVALAGGTLRSIDMAARQREAIVMRGDLVGMELQRAALLAKQARLRAEARNATSIAFPEELTGRGETPAVAGLIAQEELIFKTRRDAFLTQTAALNDLKSFLDKEVESLAAQMETERTQAALIKKELDGITSLVSKGLAAAPRQFALERTTAQLQGDRLRMEASILRARQEGSKADIALLELRNKREGEVAVDLRETDQKLQELTSKYRTSEDLLHEAETLGTSSRSGEARPEPIFTITRAGAPGSGPIMANDATEVRPGDIIKVALPPMRRRSTIDERASAGGSDPGGKARTASTQGSAF